MFRPLNFHEVRIIGKRHRKHLDNIHLPEELPKFERDGRILARARLVFAAAYASPQPRAIEAVLLTLKGTGSMCSIETDRRLNSLDEVGGKRASALKDLARELNIQPEELQSLAQWEYETLGYDFLDKTRLARGVEGAQSFKEIAARHPGKNVLVGVHSAYRAEHTITALMHPDITDVDSFPDPTFMMRYGSIFELIMTTCGEVVEFRYPRIGQVA